MIFKHLKAGLNVADTDFDAIYTQRMKEVSEFHFTPVEVAKTAARYLVEKPGARVLDIGSGAGKFCMVGASCTDGHFTGVEQRESLYLLSEQLSQRYQLSNVSFMFSNILEIEFTAFDTVYFYNAFYENIVQSDPIDTTVELNRELYYTYSFYMRTQLEAMPIGTRLATYFSFLDEVPDSYQIELTDFDGKLKLWKKVA